MDIRIKKADRSVAVDFGALPQVTQDFVVKYGLTQILNDCHSQLTKDSPDFSQENVMALVNKKLDALARGDLSRKRGEKTVSGDTVESMMFDIACEEIKAGLAKAGIKIKATDLKERAKARVAGHADRLRAKAETRLAELAELADDIDF